MNDASIAPTGITGATPVIDLTKDTFAHSTAGLSRLVRGALRFVIGIEHGSLTITLPDGRVLRVAGNKPGPDGHVTLKDESAIKRLLKRGDIGFCEAYLEGEWDSPDVVAFLQVFFINRDLIMSLIDSTPLFNLITNIRHWLRSNTKAQARKNIHAHYDLGNAFYGAWLDETMTYSSALFTTGKETLAQAQTAKYAAMAQKLDLQAGDHVLEIGCGWGGFAEYAVRTYGCRITGLTISPSQREFAIARIKAAGIEDHVDIVLRDYRDETATYDKIASIEMIEAVGEKFWPGYFKQVHDRLKPGGRACVQAITIRDSDFSGYRERPDFIQTYIFPGGMLIPRSAMIELGEKAGLEITAEQDFGLSYARTLATWLMQFQAAWPQVQPLGFDDRFRRLWEFYLQYCEAGFRATNVNVRQIAYRRPA